MNNYTYINCSKNLLPYYMLRHLNDSNIIVKSRYKYIYPKRDSIDGICCIKQSFYCDVCERHR